MARKEGTMPHKDRENLRVGILLLALLAVLFGLFKWFTRPSLSSYQSRFGFSLDGIKVRIVDHYHEDAWRDPWSCYAARISGSIEGSVFDPALMDEGLPPVIVNTLALNDGDMAAAGRKPLFKEKAGATYRTRVLVEKLDTSPGNWKNHLFIIYAPEEELYYVFYESFVASN